MTLRTSLAAALCAAAVTVAATGCSMTVAELPMPEPGIGGPGYTLHATFRDALNLPDRAHVKIGGTDIGVVTGISTTSFLADVEMLIRTDIQLPEGTTVELRQATPLGDIFVAVTLPSAEQAGPPLRPGATIGAEHTASAASVEQLMMSVSMLINGGGLNQAARITAELDAIFAGKAPQLQHLIGEMTSVITALNERTGDLDATLHGLSVLTGELARRKAELGAAADSFPQLIGLFAENNQAIVDLITKVAVTMDALGDFSASNGPQFVSLFQSIQNLMNGFVQMGDDLTGALDGFHQIYPSVMDSMRGPNLSVGAILSYLDIGAITDPAGSRWPDGTDIPAFVGSITDVIAKVTGRLNSTPQAPPQEGPR
ncbi:MCE family protein [Nocardia sp. AG03]|uniref:MCE family protein n=1 Tax=Nocardia sp. AG03 TaxID=3025312 RepID=UPI002418488A|nr:MCE family protein [Nocardia sp. AG03]